MKKVPLDYVKDVLAEYAYSFSIPEDEYRIKVEGLKGSRTVTDVALWCQYWKLTPINMGAVDFVNSIIEKGKSALTE
jgi:hypothetical protein